MRELKQGHRHQLINSPYRLAPIGQIIGTAAAEVASRIRVPNDIDYLASTSDEAKFAVSETAKSFRFHDRPQLELSGNQLPVLGRWDVVVVGGGTSEPRLPWLLHERVPELCRLSIWMYLAEWEQQG